MSDKPRKNEAKTPNKVPEGRRFQPGNPGRPKGSRNKLGEAFLEDLLVSWEAQGPSVIQRVIAEKPEQYLKVVASLMPKDLNVNLNQMGEMTDDQLIERMKKLDATIRPFLTASGAGGSSGGDRAETTH